ncbi:MAG: pyruvate, orthophosphate dikinase [Actinomycetota bacterium]|nr:pyruvate, orthophosphate dikinase [Actinomycetota bacterium]MEA2486401.1 pyruvate, orthophosphate dikinase [Actinomycetota bacterium]
MKWVYDFTEGDTSQKNLLGGKGANLAEMTNIGLPVPPGFTITTEACNAYREGDQSFPSGLLDEVAEHRKHLEEKMGRQIGNATDPLLVSVRSGAPFSMPGMMDTVLNVGLNDESVEGLIRQTSSERFAWDSYRRLVQMFGKTVMGVDGDLFEEEIDAAKEKKGVSNDVDLDTKDLQGLVKSFKKIIRKETKRDFPQDPTDQLHDTIEAVFRSWDNKRAQDYRRRNKISDALGTAVNIQTMVFGNKGDDSGTGVAFTRDPSTGERKPYGDYLTNAQGEDVVAGIRNTLKLEEMGAVQPAAWQELQQHMDRLERHFKDMCDIEFTVEQGKLWLLQTRVGKRTALAEWQIASDMVAEGLTTPVAVVRDRLTAGKLDEMFKPVIRADLKSSKSPVARGLNASPGAAVGMVVFTADDAAARADGGSKVILVRRETTPDDYHGMVAAQGILTSSGGTNSHAAVVARGEGIPAVCGADAIRIDRTGKRFTIGNLTVKEGDWITIDGTDGTVYSEALETQPSQLDAALLGDKKARNTDLWRAFETFMKLADDTRRLKVRANADTPEQARNARARGAQGIGLCRTEHMFLGEERVKAVRKMIFADTPDEEQEAYDALLPLQRNDFVGIFKAMSGLPVTVRLLDPPLHEFLPNHVDLAVALAVAEATKKRKVTLRDEKLSVAEARELLAKVEELHEANPMLGLRGVRLGIIKPGLYAMQVRAIVEAACAVKKKGGDPVVEIMIPLVATSEELRQMREELEPVAHEVLEKKKVDLDILFGTMIELPRACVAADSIAEHADFFSFGTNDLTQTAFGFSRDDIGKFLAMYEERKLVPTNPFVTIDEAGVGRLMEEAVKQGKEARADIHLGICGEHGGDPDSVVFCDRLGLDYVSCSPFRIPTARLAAAQAVLGAAESSSK